MFFISGSALFPADSLLSSAICPIGLPILPWLLIFLTQPVLWYPNCVGLLFRPTGFLYCHKSGLVVYRAWQYVPGSAGADL